MRIYLEMLGCRLNYAEMAMLGRQLADAGHELAESAVGADLCVLNSCTVTGEAARKSRQLVRQMARGNPGARLVVTGCYATLEGENTAALPNVALVVGNDRKAHLLDLVEELGKKMGEARTGPAIADVVASPTIRPSRRTRAFIKVQDGCDNRCTFCIVTVASVCLLLQAL